MREAPKEIIDYLTSHNTVILSTYGKDGLWSTPVFYVNRGARLYFLSDPQSIHSQNLAENPAAAAAVTEDYRDWQEIQGLQLRGKAYMLTGFRETAVVMALYLKKYPAAGHILQNPGSFKGAAKARWHCIEPEYMKFTNNTKKFGEHLEFEF